MNQNVHICPVLMQTVIWENGDCKEDCSEEDCPILKMLNIETLPTCDMPKDLTCKAYTE